MPTTVTLSTPVLKKAIERYYKELEEYKGRADNEMAVRTAFFNLLAETARQVKWMLIPEQTIEGGIRPDGVLRDNFDLKRGFWEAKGPRSDLDKEIARKIATGYPLINTIFENTKRAVLFQNKRRLSEFNLHNPTEVSDLLTQFFTYTEPDIATFEAAVQEFKERVPELARALLTIIEREYKLNKKFITAFDAFAELCRQSLEWVIDQYQMSEDKRSGIVSDPNNLDDEEYIVRLVGKVVTVSVETVRLVNELAMAVRMEDWMGE
jgi:hypothetical protein